jgi:hypothetical protein
MKTTTLTAIVCRWIARSVGVLLSVLFLVVMVVAARQVGMLNLLTNPRLRLSLVGQAGAALMVVGFLAGWRWEHIGGILSLVGLCLIYPAARMYGKITWFFTVMAAPGVLYITSHLLMSYASRRSKTQPPAGSNA